MQLPAWFGNRKRWLREGLFFVVLFVLMSLNSWNRLTTVNDFGRALIYFLILYGQAQFHRFMLFPFLFNQQVRRYVVLTTLCLLGGSLLL